MDNTFTFIFLSLVLSPGANAAQCGDGWIPYKDELCVKAINSYVGYEDAKRVCSAQGDGHAKSSLVIVQDSDMQELLGNATKDMLDNVWIGSKYEEKTSQFLWDDGSPLTFTNWDTGYPKISYPSNACVELRPVTATTDSKTYGKWGDVSCHKRNMVVCQRQSSWSLQDAVQEIIRLRANHYAELESLENRLYMETAELKDAVQSIQRDLLSTKQELVSIASNVVPIESVYIEYYGQPSPTSLWPTLTWEDISGTYAGLFFRASGGESADWGSVQPECAPRITERDFATTSNSTHLLDITIPSNGWSDFGRTGYFKFMDIDRYVLSRFFTQGCEVRPRNQAIRIWKRTA